MSSQSSSQFQQLGRSSPVLSYFCIYNTSLGGTAEDNAKDQILYYTADEKSMSTDDKMRQIGLAQALVNFTSTFSKTQRISQSVHSQKNRMIFYQPEPGFWMHICIELGVSRRQLRDAKGKEKLITEYLDSQLNDMALEAVLRVGYEQFKLLNGTFSSIVYETEPYNITQPSTMQPARQKIRALMYAMEEFFSDWVWRWDFDRLDTMCFDAVFNGVPNKPILRKNYLKINEAEETLQKTLPISHMFILNDGGLVYKSMGLNIHDVRALRKFVMRKVDIYNKNEKRKFDTAAMNKNPVTSPSTSTDLIKPFSGLKQLTKTLTQTPFLNYFSSFGSKSTETSNSVSHNIPGTALDQPSVSEEASLASTQASAIKHGVYLTGLVESTAISMSGEGRVLLKTDLVRVFLKSSTSANNECDQQRNGPDLNEYFLVVYKHESGLVWNFLLPKTEVASSLLTDVSFYANLEQCLYEGDLESLTTAVIKNLEESEEKSVNLGKRYQCFFYDNTTLDVKSTIDIPRSTVQEKKLTNQPLASMTNEIFLHLLNIKEDFEKKISCSSEIYSRSTRNHWVAGSRFNHSTPEDIISGLCEVKDSKQDYTEMYLIAAKKDTTLADVEAALSKMNKNLIEALHLE